MVSMDLRRLRMVLTFTFIAGVSGCGGGGGGSSLPGITHPLGASLPVVARSEPKLATVGNILPSYLAIDAGGGPAVGSWIADTDFQTSGYSGAAKVASVIDTSHVPNPAPQSVYQSQRFGQTVTYVIPQLNPNSAYNVRLHFVESFWTGAGKRLFNASINGSQVLTNFDIFAASGGMNVAIAKQYSTYADAGGKITIAMMGTVDRASIAAIEINAGGALASPTPVPWSPQVAINVGGAAIANWLGDSDYQQPSGWSGTTVVASPINASRVTNAAPQGVYQTQRYAPSLTYAIPKLTPNAAYAVRIDLAETFWSGAGQRLFNVSINGTQVLSNFDIFVAAGGKNNAIEETFNANADATGTITIAFVATVDRATIAGIEVNSGSGGPTPSPSPSASPTPTTSDALPGELAQVFSNSSPLRSALDSQKNTTFAAGSSTEVNAWNTEVAGGPAGGGPFGPYRPFNYGMPIYVSTNPNDTLVTVARCTDFGGNCAMVGTKVHVNPNDLIQSIPDQHLLLIDPSLNVEVDCWRALSRAGSQDSGSGDLRPDLSGNTLTCGWGGAYALTSTGIRGSFSNESSGYLGDGIHFGPAAGTFFVTPNEMLRGQINHAVALNANCANGRGIYPANDLSATDMGCYGGGSGPPHYGDAFQLNWSSAKIAASGHSRACKAILTAMATYGAYISDTANYGQAIDIVSEYAYTSDPGEMGSDPYPAILTDLQSGRGPDGSPDADGSGNWTYCFNGLQASDFNLVELTPP